MKTAQTGQSLSPTPAESGRGLIYGLCAYLIWGFFPAFFKAIGAVPALQVVSHRIVWSVVLLLLLSYSAERRTALRQVFIDWRSLLILVTTAILIAVNWLVFIIAVGHAQVLQSSLGYFITPFVSVLLGRMILKEQLNNLQLFSLFLAAIGVIALTVSYGTFPWTALILAITFGSYGLLRKIVRTDAMAGLTVETMLLAPFAAGYLVRAAHQGQSAFPSAGLQTSLLLMSAGIVTAVPLLFFAAAARRLKMSTIGFLQYITPTLHFLLAVLAYGEIFTVAHLISFLFIWAGLICYSWDAWRALSGQRRNDLEREQI